MVFDNIIHALTNGYFSLGSNVKMNSSGIVTDKNLFITKSGFTECIVISQMPPIFDKDIKRELTRSLKERNNYNIKAVNVYFEVKKAFLDVHSPSYSRMMNKANENFLKHKELFESLDVDMQKYGVRQNTGLKKFSFGKENVLREKLKYDTYNELYDFKTKGDGALFNVTAFILVTYKDKASFDAYKSNVSAIVSSFFKLKKAYKVDKKISETLENYSPSTQKNTNLRYPEFLATNYNLANLMSLKHNGIVANYGVVVGRDMRTNAPVISNFLETAEASNSVVLAPSGWGKSYLCYNLTLQMLGKGYKLFYIDVKGREVTECLSSCVSNMQTINFSAKMDANGDFPSDTKIMNTMIIDSVFPGYSKELAAETTADWLLMLGDISQFNNGVKNTLYTDLRVILINAVNSYYNVVGVDKAWENSYAMTYSNLNNYIKDAVSQHPNADIRKEGETFYTRISPKLDSTLFKDNTYTLSLTDLISSNLTVFDFGIGDKVNLDNMEYVKLYMCLACIKILIQYNKSQGVFSHLMFEECQQVQHVELLMKEVASLASGARAKNFSMTTITNAMNVFDNVNMSTVASNTSHLFLGPASENDLRVLKSKFKMEDNPSTLTLVEEITKNKMNYPSGFVFHFSNKVRNYATILSTNLPPDLEKRFATRDVEGAA